MKFKQRNYINTDDNAAIRLSQSLGISRLSASILVNRGYDTVDDAKEYLGQTGYKFSNPFDLSNMNDAVERINRAIAKDEKIVIYSDYDTDGVCGCSILLNGFDTAGYQNISYYTPQRIGEGYGLNPEAVGKLAREKCSLLITVDCGISNVEEIKLGKFLGMDVIVTDHHSCPPVLPDCTIVNPKLSGAKGQENLCGAAVALKVSQAVFGGSSQNAQMELAAIATVADMVPLIGENRHIVHKGLELINTVPSKAVKELVNLVVGEKDVTSEDIGYKLGPIINAAGRISTAHICIDLFTGRADNIKDMAVQLVNYNNERKDIQNDVYKQAKEKVHELDLINNNGIVLYDEDWALGVVGIVASRLMNDYGRPIVMLSKTGEKIKGSVRSVDGINIFDVLSGISDLFESFGGHSKAAGLTLKNQDVAGFADKFNRALDEYDKALFDKSVYYDIECTAGEIDIDTVNEIKMMEPFGQDNPSVSVLLKGASVRGYGTMGKEKIHYKADFVTGTEGIKGIGFFSSLPEGAARGNMLCDMVVTPGINVYNGYTSIQGIIDGIICYYPDEISYLNYIKSIEDKFIASKMESTEEYSTDAECSYEIAEIDEVREHFANTSYQSLIVVDDINIAKILYNVLGEKVMNSTHIAQGEIDTSVNGANTILLAPAYNGLKSKIYTRVYYISVNDNENIVKRLSQTLHDNIQMVIMGNIISAETKTLSIERLRQVYRVLRNTPDRLVGYEKLIEYGYKSDIARHEMIISHKIFTESGLLIVDEATSEYTVMSKATIDVKDTLSYKKYIIE